MLPVQGNIPKKYQGLMFTIGLTFLVVTIIKTGTEIKVNLKKLKEKS